MQRAYYRSTITHFLNTSDTEILGELAAKHTHRQLEEQQLNAWKAQIRILKSSLNGLNGYLYFEFSIPRMGKRIDNVVILGSHIFLLEFKIGARQYDAFAINQVIDYALDIRNFHEGSHHADLIPVLIAEQAPNAQNDLQKARNFQTVVRLNQYNLAAFLNTFLDASNKVLDIQAWEQSAYKPTPTIVEAAQALYQNHDVKEITRSDSGAQNLSETANTIDQIIIKSKQHRQKSICFITGVPGAGKTLAGLNIANQRLQTDEDEHAVFLSGNGPLVMVLQEALSRNHQSKNKKVAQQEVKAFIQNIHHFRDEYLNNLAAPVEKVVIFDEAQRAWNQQQTSKFMAQKRGKSDFNQSEPEFLISVMNRHTDWCTIICLIGGGQEINTGEAGLQEWIGALKNQFPKWKIYYSDLIVNEAHYLGDNELKTWLKSSGIAQTKLHLAVSIRSFRSEKVSAFIHALLTMQQEAKALYQEIKTNYPIVLTRDLAIAKQWLRIQAKGSERFGLIASSGARRIKALGVNVKNEIDVAQWFLNPPDDVRSSYFLEDVATEFDVQGLELDWACVAWDANFYPDENSWYCQAFKGNKWQKIHKIEDKNYLENAHRVLLTRARQGMVIWIPEGSRCDKTRNPDWYDKIYHYLKKVGIEELQKEII